MSRIKNIAVLFSGSTSRLAIESVLLPPFRGVKERAAELLRFDIAYALGEEAALVYSCEDHFKRHLIENNRKLIRKEY